MMPDHDKQAEGEVPIMMPDHGRITNRALPSTNKLTIKIGYDDSFNADTSDPAAYLNAMVTHVQAHFCLDSLGSKVQVERVGDLTYHAGQTWRAESSSGSLSGPVKDLTAASTSGANLHVYMAKDQQYFGVVGVAWLGTLCVGPWKPYQASINEKRSSILSTAEVVTHEIGHNVGMYHDFDSIHNGKGCDGTGFMSYGSHPYEWSTCSRDDFKAQYNKVTGQYGLPWCLPAAPNACGDDGSNPGTTTTTAAPPTGDCAGLATHPNWWQDKFCDDFLNTPECGYDGGDCCFRKISGWNNYCSTCQCLGANCPDLREGWFRDRFCDDFMNTAGCFYDGGDCCKKSHAYWDYFCDVCECLDPLF